MIDVLNKIIGYLVGVPGTYLIPFDGLGLLYSDWLTSISGNFDQRHGVGILLTFLVSNPQVVMSLIFYFMMFYCAVWVILLVPFRLVRSLCPGFLRRGK